MAEFNIRMNHWRLNNTMKFLKIWETWIPTSTDSCFKYFSHLVRRVLGFFWNGPRAARALVISTS